jgi:UDP-GlcNAc:undecaprenyl-phosphate GlcNAc-1-phosphate transferase
MAPADPITIGHILESAGRAVSLRAWEVSTVAFGTLAALALLNIIAPRLDLIDHPDAARRKHVRPVPLTGGLAILLGIWFGSLAGMELRQIPLDVLALLGIVAVIHTFDDQSGLSARQRLVIDAVVALAFIVITGNTIETLGTALGIELRLGPLAVPITIFIYLALTNAYNMIDGLDGLVLTQLLIALLGIAFWHVALAHKSGFAPLALSVMVACLVILAANLGLLGRFLKCFMGDSGARFLGFFLVYVLVAEGQRILSPIEAVYFVALPLLDMCAVVVERLRAGQGPMQGDRRHLHYLLVDAGVTHGRTVLIMGAISCSLIGLYFVQYAAGLGDFAIWLVFMGFACLYWRVRRSLVRSLGSRLAPHHVAGPAE